MNHKLLTFSLLTVWAGMCSGQIVTTNPPIIQTDTRDIKVTFHADQGNCGLMNLPASEAVYAHTGVITEQQKGWEYAPKWLDNSSKYKLEYAGPNTYTLSMSSINEYYGIPDGSPAVTQLAFVFRNATGSKEGKTATGGDIFVDVLPAGYQMVMTADDNGGIVDGDGVVNFTVNVTSDSDIRLYEGSTSSTPFASAESSKTLSASFTLASPGDYHFIAVASDGEQTISRELKLTRVASSESQKYPGGIPKMGAVENEDGSVTFCIAAPGKESAIIVGSWTDFRTSSDMQMKYHDYEGYRYFWITVNGLEKGKDHIYYYIIDGTRKVGDPYAHLVLDPDNDKYIPRGVFPNLPSYPSDKVTGVPLAVYNSHMDSYSWEVEDFTGVPQSELMIYELLLRDFTGTEGQAYGDGTVNGAIEKLDYLKSLGVNAVELMPIMEFNGNNSWGYNTNFYLAPDKAYGTPDDYKRFVDECHKRGMAVILDIVFNQSDWLHPWYQMYDIKENPFYNGSAPHDYSVLNDWSQDNPIVQQQWRDALTYWMTAYKADGFRFDLVKGLGDNDSYGTTYNPSTNTWSAPSAEGTNRYNASRVARMKALHQAMMEVNPHAYFINENLAGAQEENEMAADGEINWANINYPSCQFAMGYSQESSLNRFYAPLDGNRLWGSTVSYAESHDEERMAYKQKAYGIESVKSNEQMALRRLGSVAAQLILTPGAHMIWQFQEIGADQTTKNAYGNDTSPKKVVWSLLDDASHAALKDTYATLIDIRNSNPELFAENAEISVNLSGWDNGRNITLSSGDKTLVLAVNPNPTTDKRVSLPINIQGYRLLASSPGIETHPEGSSAMLPPGAFAVFATENVTGIDAVTPDAEATIAVYSTPGEIHVEGVFNNASAYDTAGRRVGLTALQRGIYIVAVDNFRYKIFVP